MLDEQINNFSVEEIIEFLKYKNSHLKGNNSD